MKAKLVQLKRNDPDIVVLQTIHNEPSVKEYIFLADNYFDYVTTTRGVVYYKIVYGGEVVGGLHTEIEKEKMYINICVSENYRRKGIAEIALKQLFKHQQCESEIVEAYIDKKNIPSLALFKKLGFVQRSEEDGLIMFQKSF